MLVSCVKGPCWGPWGQGSIQGLTVVDMEASLVVTKFNKIAPKTMHGACQRHIIYVSYVSIGTLSTIDCIIDLRLQIERVIPRSSCAGRFAFSVTCM